jgi:hypothetical protein
MKYPALLTFLIVVGLAFASSPSEATKRRLQGATRQQAVPSRPSIVTVRPSGRHHSGWPDLTVDAAYLAGCHYSDGSMEFWPTWIIYNKGTAAVTLEGNWTKPWVTLYPTIDLSRQPGGFVQPYQAGKTITLNPGDKV